MRMTDLLSRTNTLTKILDRSVLNPDTASALYTLHEKIDQKLQEMNYQPDSTDDIDVSEFELDETQTRASIEAQSVEESERAAAAAQLQNAKKLIINEIDTSLYARKRHTYTEEEKRFKCALCDYRAPRRDVVKAHLRTHSNDRPFACSLCSYKSKDSYGLGLHKRRHTGEKAYKCGVCSIAFALSSSLIVHMRTHTGEKPYKCPHCPYAATTGASAAAHINSSHLKEKHCKCPHCDFRTAHASSLKQHIKTHSPKQHIKTHCTPSNIEQNTIGRKSAPISSTSWSCGMCGDVLKTKFYLFEHLQVHEKMGHTLQSDDSCQYCDIGTAHPGQFEGLKCPNCNFVSSRCYEVSKHLKDTHRAEPGQVATEVELATITITNNEMQ